MKSCIKIKQLHHPTADKEMGIDQMLILMAFSLNVTGPSSGLSSFKDAVAFSSCPSRQDGCLYCWSPVSLHPSGTYVNGPFMNVCQITQSEYAIYFV